MVSFTNVLFVAAFRDVELDCLDSCWISENLELVGLGSLVFSEDGVDSTFELLTTNADVSSASPHISESDIQHLV